MDQAGQGKRLGETLLLDALGRCQRLAEHVGVVAVEVQAIDAQARGFYLKYGFTPLADDALHLYLPMKVVRKLFS